MFPFPKLAYPCLGRDSARAVKMRMSLPLMVMGVFRVLWDLQEQKALSVHHNEATPSYHGLVLCHKFIMNCCKPGKLSILGKAQQWCIPCLRNWTLEILIKCQARNDGSTALSQGGNSWGLAGKHPELQSTDRGVIPCAECLVPS